MTMLVNRSFLYYSKEKILIYVLWICSSNVFDPSSCATSIFKKKCMSCLHWVWLCDPDPSRGSPSLFLDFKPEHVVVLDQDCVKSGNVAEAWNVIAWLGFSLHASAFVMRRPFPFMKPESEEGERHMEETWSILILTSSPTGLNFQLPHTNMTGNNLLFGVSQFMTICFLVTFW